MPELTVKNEEAQSTLLSYLQNRISLAPPAYLRQLIKAGKIEVNGKAGEADQVLQPGETVTLPQSRRLQECLAETNRLPRVLFETDEILIVHKPHNLATHSSPGHERDNLVDRVVRKFRAEQKTFKTAAVHRLDVPTSGPVLFGKGQRAISTLGRLMQTNGIRKSYLALVAKGLPNAGLLASNITSKGKLKYAETGFRVLSESETYSLVELDLRTGRQHQIRKQLAERGFPIAGDRRYHGPKPDHLNRLFLHCHKLAFLSPFSDDLISIEDPLPSKLAEILASQNLQPKRQPDSATPIDQQSYNSGHLEGE